MADTKTAGGSPAGVRQYNRSDSHGALVASAMINQLASTLAQRSEVKIERERVALMEELGREAAQSAFQNEMAQLDAEKRQRDIEVGRHVAEQRRAGLEARSLARVAAGETGTSGQTIDDLMADYERIEATNTLRLLENRQNVGMTEGYQEAAAIARRAARTPDLTAPEFSTVAGLVDVVGAGLGEHTRVSGARSRGLGVHPT